MAVRRVLSLAALVVAGACGGPTEPRLPADRELLETAVRFYRASRGETGLYRDRLRFDGAHEGPASIATTGMGLVSLCIGSRLGISPNAEADAATTLRMVLEMTQARNGSGFYYHFVDIETGDRAGESEYSSIDTAILMAGALFAASCLGDAGLDSLVERLWDSIDWSRAVADPATGGIYLEMLEDGAGKPGAVTLPFNEYMLVAWLATLDDPTGAGPATDLWESFYADPDSLPTAGFAGHALLTDRPGGFLSSFVIQFAYYLCHPFTVSEGYRAFLRSAALADRAWWGQTGLASSHEWGLGAGSARSVGYHADAINDNPDRLVSPHVIAGFLPVDDDATSDLAWHLAATTGAVRAIAGVEGPILWRYSVSDPSWWPAEIQGIDYASLMLGLAGSVLGGGFVATHNDFATWLGLTAAPSRHRSAAPRPRGSRRARAPRRRSSAS